MTRLFELIHKEVVHALAVLRSDAPLCAVKRETQVKDVRIGTAYSIWVGIGAVGAGVMGILLFKEPATFARVSFMILLVVSIVGLKFTSTH